MNTQSRALTIGGEENYLDDLKGFSLDSMREKWKRIDYLIKQRKVLKTLEEKEKSKLTKEEKEIIKRIKKELTNGEDNIPASQTIAEVASGKYFRKPYEQEKLIDYCELSPKLKTSIIAKSTCSVGLGVKYQPFGSPDITINDYDAETRKKYEEQKFSLRKYVKRITKKGDDFDTTTFELALYTGATGESYLELVKDNMGKTLYIKPAVSKYIFVGKDKDRYIQIYRGKTVYFRPFWEDNPVPRSANSFEPAENVGGISIKDQATTLIHFKIPNFVSSIYGVPEWTPGIPDLLGNRAASERNYNLMQNDAVPRLVVLISGGTLTDDSVKTTKSFFKKHKGIENTGRVLILEVTGLNAGDVDQKTPSIQLVPLTIGQTDDASFLKYSAATEQTVRELLRISNLFLGTAEDINRAAAFTMREMTVNLIFEPYGKIFSNKLNSTLLYDWMAEDGLNDETCLVEFGFVLPNTISQKDMSVIKSDYAGKGGLTPNDLREDIGLQRIEEPWADLPQSLLIVLLQMEILTEEDEGISTDFTKGKLLEIIEKMKERPLTKSSLAVIMQELKAEIRDEMEEK